jgi:release factor glutamine methyltransferase
MRVSGTPVPPVHSAFRNARSAFVYNPATMSRPTPQTWTTRRLLDWTAGYLEKKGVDFPRLSAEMLMGHVLEIPRIKLYMDLDRPALPLELAAFRELVERAAQHEPVQYLVGQAHFFSLTFKVDKRVLIPRPSTETLVEHIIQHARLTPGFAQPAIADVCTGSGCIAVALAKNIPGARVIATDIRPEALEVAKENAERNKVADRIEFRLGNLLEPLGTDHFAFIVSNPPYIPDHEWEAVERNVKEYEPTHALRGGKDGLEFLRPLIAEAPTHLTTPGQIVLEIGASEKDAVLKLAGESTLLSNARVLADHEGYPRMLIADRVE